MPMTSCIRWAQDEELQLQFYFRITQSFLDLRCTIGSVPSVQVKIVILLIRGRHLVEESRTMQCILFNKSFTSNQLSMCSAKVLLSRG